MAFTYIKYLFSLFPRYFKEKDSYKDNNGEGLLERYTRNYEPELEEAKTFIDDFFKILNPLICDPKYLPYLSYMLGNLPTISQEQANRKLLKWAIRLFQTKGTTPSYKFIFNLFGLGVDIIETFGPRPFKYDLPFSLYDAAKYDTKCPCSNDLEFAYWNLNDDCTTGTLNPVDPDVIDSINKLLCIVKPIDVNIKGFIRHLRVCDDFEIIGDIDEEVDTGAGSCSLVTGIGSEDGKDFDDFPPPINLDFEPSVGDDGGFFDWDAPVAPPSPVVTYTSYYKEATETDWVFLTTNATSNVDNIPMTPGIPYNFRVRVNYANGVSVWVYINGTLAEASCSIVSNIQVHNGF